MGIIWILILIKKEQDKRLIQKIYFLHLPVFFSINFFACTPT